MTKDPRTVSSGEPRNPRRRSTDRLRPGRRIDATVLVAVLVPVLTLLGALLVHAEVPADRPGDRPRLTALTRSTIICPDGGGTAAVATTTDASGTVGVRVGDTPDELSLTAHTSTGLVDDGRGPLVVTGGDDLAPGLVAGRFSSPPAAADCGPPVFDQWFTGVGAGAKHASVLELVNPDAGRAVVDVQVLGPGGVVDAPDLRGVAVPGGDTVRLDLAAVVPRRGELALRVQTVRGRVSAHLSDAVDRLGTSRPASDWLAGQETPRRRNVLLGLPADAGRQVLVVSNPTDTSGRATIRVVTPSAVFTPAGGDDVEVPPQSTVSVSVGGLVGQAREDARKADEPLGLQVESSVPTTASLRARVGEDLLRTSPAAGLSEAGSALLPGPGRQETRRLLLGDATGTGTVTMTSWDADGEALPDQSVDVGVGSAAAVDLPTKARLVTIEPGSTGVGAVVLLADRDGVAVVRIRQPPTSGEVPAVRPGLP